MRARCRNEQRGFTIIELMVVVVIIGILAALAIPRFMRSTTRSKQTEAQEILKQVYTLQQVYRESHNAYWGACGTLGSASMPDAFKPLGMAISTTSRYSYSICTIDDTHYTGTATCSILDDDPSQDVWQIDQDGNLVCLVNDAIL